MTIKYTKWQRYIPNGLKTDQVAIKYIPTSSIARPSKIYLNSLIPVVKKLCS
jgi:hypothetical protein